MNESILVQFTDGNGAAGGQDVLTGLVTMQAFRAIVQKRLDAMGAAKKGLCVAYFDIDNFKSFNERHGFVTGDTLLKDVARVMREAFPDDIIARFADDHFVLLTPARNVVPKIKEVHRKVRSFPGGTNAEIKAGVYIIDAADTDVGTMYDRARLACNSVKGTYDTAYKFYSFSLRNKIAKQQYIVSHIEEAIAGGNIMVYYQPITRIFTGKLCGVEALARWRDGEYGFISPEEFIGVLEQCHLIHKLDTFVVEQVCRDYRYLIDNGLTCVPPSINLSRMDFQLCDIFGAVDGIVTRYGIDKSMLHIEITESAITDNPKHLQDTVAKFKENGYKVWMDDFGSGQSSLNTLKDFDFDVLKIDMKFLSAFHSNPKSRIIITSIVDLAKKLGIQTLIEGVETQEELDFLKQIGCEKAQGYLFSRPMRFEDLCALTMEKEPASTIPYYDSIGRINFLSQNPLADDGAHLDILQSELSGVPVSIVEHRGGRFKFLSYTSSYEKVVQSTGLANMAAAEDIMNNGHSQLHDRLMALAARAVKSGGKEIMDFIYNGYYCNIQVRLIATGRDGAEHTFAAILQNLSQFTQVRKNERLERISNFIFSAYNRIDLLDVDGAFEEHVYLSSSQYNEHFTPEHPSENVADYAAQCVHPDDRQRFCEFYDFEDIWNQLIRQHKNHITNFFRIKNAAGGYDWQLYAVLAVELDGKRKLLSCSRSLDMDRLRELDDEFVERYED